MYARVGVPELYEDTI